MDCVSGSNPYILQEQYNRWIKKTGRNTSKSCFIHVCFEDNSYKTRLRRDLILLYYNNLRSERVYLKVDKDWKYHNKPE